MNVHELRQNGCKVFIRHWRYREGERPALNKNRPELLIPNKEIKVQKRKVFPRGGKTAVLIKFPSKTESRSETLCSVTDNFSYKRGVDICLGRLKTEINQNLKTT